MKRVLAVLALTSVLLTPTAALADTYGVRAVLDGGSFKWRPAHRDIAVGDRIRWRNPSGFNHNVRAYGGNWTFFRTLAPGDSVRRTFNNAGTYKYRCTIHSTLNNGNCNGMCGRIHV